MAAQGLCRIRCAGSGAAGQSCRKSTNYDLFNRLVGRSADLDGNGTIDLEQRYVYDGLKVVLEFEKDGPGALAASDLANRYLWESAVDQLLAQEKVDATPGQAADVLWPLCDRLGTVRDLAAYDDATGETTIENHRVYDAFGNLQDETDPAVVCLFGYTGQMSDEATGLQNNLNRWYDPSTGRWLSEDPIGFSAGDLNLTRYVGNQPTLFVDPLGLHECEDHGGRSSGTGDGDEPIPPLPECDISAMPEPTIVNAVLPWQMGWFNLGPGLPRRPGARVPGTGALDTGAYPKVPGTGTADTLPTRVPTPSPNFRPPTNPPQVPPSQIPPGWRIRSMPPTELYPNGYWILESPPTVPGGKWHPIDPSTMKPGGGRPGTHVPWPDPT